MTDETLKVLADLTVRLTELRMRECAHLAIENYAPELFARLVVAAQDPMRTLAMS